MPGMKINPHRGLSSFSNIVKQLETLRDLAGKTTGKHSIYEVAAAAVSDLTAPEKLSQEEIQSAQQLRDYITQEHKQLNTYQVERRRLNNLEKELKMKPANEYSALDLAEAPDMIMVFYRGLLTSLNMDEEKASKKIHDTILERIQQDAKIIHDVLTPTVKIIRQEDGSTTEQSYNSGEFHNHPPDAIFVLGNSDLNHVDLAVKHYLAIPKDRRPIIYVSGLGGHTTKDGYSFGLTEAETMLQRLLELGVDIDHIRIEYDATETIHNVKYNETVMLIEYVLRNQEDPHFLDKYLLNLPVIGPRLETRLQFIKRMAVQDPKHKISPQDEEALHEYLKPVREFIKKKKIVLHPHILVTGTPSQNLRQLQVVEHKLSLPWQTLSVMPPSFAEIREKYYPDVQRGLINLIYSLREISTMMYGLMNGDLPARSIRDKTGFKEMIKLLVNYYYLMKESMTGQLSAKKLDANKFAENFIGFCDDISNNRGHFPKMEAAVTQLSKYFRWAFDQIECSPHIKHLPSNISAVVQSERMDVDGIYGRYNLDNSMFARRPRVARVKSDDEYKQSQSPHLTEPGVPSKSMTG